MVTVSPGIVQDVRARDYLEDGLLGDFLISEIEFNVPFLNSFSFRVACWKMPVVLRAEGTHDLFQSISRLCARNFVRLLGGEFRDRSLEFIDHMRFEGTETYLTAWFPLVADRGDGLVTAARPSSGRGDGLKHYAASSVMLSIGPLHRLGLAYLRHEDRAHFNPDSNFYDIDPFSLPYQATGSLDYKTLSPEYPRWRGAESARTHNWPKFPYVHQKPAKVMHDSTVKLLVYCDTAGSHRSEDATRRRYNERSANWLKGTDKGKGKKGKGRGKGKESRGKGKAAPW